MSEALRGYRYRLWWGWQRGRYGDVRCSCGDLNPYTQTVTAGRIGVSGPCLSMWERSVTHPSTVIYWCRWFRALGIRVSVIVESGDVYLVSELTNLFK